MSQKILKGEPTYPVTNPPVSMPCLHAISSLLEKNRKKRIGAIGFETFTDNPFFRPIDFVALERKEIDPIFIPSSDKTNFDATYDLEELLLEEAPLEARARRQKPREALKDDATDQEIRAEELHKMIETLFEPFNYTTVADQRPAAVAVADDSTATHLSNNSNNTPTSSNSPQEWAHAQSKNSQDDQLRPSRSTTNPKSTRSTRSTTHSPNGSPPLGTATLARQGSTDSPSSQRGERTDYFPADGSESATPSFSRPMNSRQRGSQRSTSMGGGVQVVLNETGSWSDMANQSSSLLQNPNPNADKPTGMLGFLSRKKGRDRSPKAKERGVLGKEGARVIISNT